MQLQLIKINDHLGCPKERSKYSRLDMREAETIIPILIDEDKSLLALCDEVLGFFFPGNMLELIKEIMYGKLTVQMYPFLLHFH